jgi:hypothetical protein
MAEETADALSTLMAEATAELSAEEERLCRNQWNSTSR